MATTVRKFSGDKAPRVRNTSTAIEDTATAGPIENSGLTVSTGVLLGRGSPGDGEIQQLEVVGDAVEQTGTQIRFLADAVRSEGLGQFGDTTSAALRGVITDPTGTGSAVFNTNPEFVAPRIDAGVSYLSLVTTPSSTPHTIGFPAADDTVALLAATQTLSAKTLASPSITGAEVTHRQDQNGITYFVVRNDDAGAGAYVVYRLRLGSSGVDWLANQSVGLSQIAGFGTVTQHQEVFNTFVWYNASVVHLARLTAAGLRIGTTASAATSLLTVEGSVALGPIVTETAATHTLAATTTHLIANRAGTITVTLPAASSFPNRVVWVRTITANTVVSASSNVVPKAGGAAGTAILAGTAGNWAMLVSDATNWQIQAGT